MSEAGTQIKPVEKAPIAMTDRGLDLTSINDLARFADCVAQSGLAPKGMEKTQAIVVAIQMGMELGLTPMASVQNVAVINGRPALWGDAVLAVCQNHPNYLDDDDEFDEATQTATFKAYTKKRGYDRPVVRTFSLEDAKKAGLWGKPGPWTQYPKRMLLLRARAFALRDAFPGALKGINIAEEIQDIPARPVVKVENENETTPAANLDEITERIQRQTVDRAALIASIGAKAAGMSAQQQKALIGGRNIEDLTDDELLALQSAVELEAA